MASSKRKTAWLRLLVTAAASEALYVLLVRLSEVPPASSWGAQFYGPRGFEATLPFYAVFVGLALLYAVALHAVWEEPGAQRVGGGAPTQQMKSGRSARIFIFLAAACFRLTIFQAHGFNTTQGREILEDSRGAPPLDRALAALANGAFSKLPRRIAPDGPLSALKLMAVASDLAALALLPGLLTAAGVPRALALTYGWSPLAITESAGSGHLESVSLVFLAIALAAAGRSHLRSAVAYGLSVSFGPVLASCLPLFTRTLRAAVLGALAVSGIGWAVWWSSLGSNPLGALRHAVETPAGGSLLPAATALGTVFVTRNPLYPVVVVLGLWAALVLLRAARPGLKLEHTGREALVAIGSFLMVAPRVFPQSFVPVAFLAGFSRNPGWLVFTLTAPLGYLHVEGDGGSFWIAFPQYFPAYAALAFFWLGRSAKSRSRPRTRA